MTDPLRKAAEELIKEWDWECGEHQNKALTELIETLRQALAQPEEKMRIEGSGKLTTKPYPDGYGSEQQFRQALAQPEQEPDTVMAKYEFQTYAAYKTDGEMKIGVVPELRQALAQPKQEAWKCICGANLYIDENGKPRSKAQPEQEPVAIVNEGMGGIEWLSKPLPEDTPLYAAPVYAVNMSQKCVDENEKFKHEPEWIEDGYGTMWQKCGKKDCGKFVVKIGKVDCWNGDCPEAKEMK